MPKEYAGKLADPEWRRDRARKATAARTTPTYYLDHVREIVKRTRAEQGLEPTVVDELALGHITELIGGAHDGPAS